MCSLSTSNGTLDEVKDIKICIFDHFNGFFKENDECRPFPSDIGFKALSFIDSEEIVKSFFKVEVKDAIWSCDRNKSTGPDGFSLEFFKSFWYLLKEDIMKFCIDFHSKGKVVRSVTSSFISLIPEVKNPQNLLEYRSICLVGSLLKVLSKILASRIKKVIGKVVSSNQTAFVPSRNMLDGIVVVNEILE